MSSLPIFLSDSTPGSGGQVTQLYPGLELFSEGEPPRHTLFVLGKAPLSVVNAEPDQLLIIDPPADLANRFVLEGNVAVLFSGEAVDVGAPQVKTRPGGLAHLRVGDHFLDVYTQTRYNVVHLPALGMLLGGPFGSDRLPPRLATGSNGDDELATLRLLAGLIKRGIQLYIPRAGALIDDRMTMMTRLADDVAYLHGLRRVAPAAVARGENFAQIEEAGKSLLPAQWSTPTGRAVHGENLRELAEVLANR